MRFITLLCGSVLALLSCQTLATPMPHLVRDVETGAENAYHEATDGVENAWDSTKHWFTGDSNTNATALGLIEQGHQSCRAIDNWFFISYTIIIGVDYDSSRCATIKEKLTEEEHVNAWKCVNDPTKGTGKEGRGYLKLQFNAGRNKELGLNKDLTSEFADINGFNCPGW